MYFNYVFKYHCTISCILLYFAYVSQTYHVNAINNLYVDIFREIKEHICLVQFWDNNGTGLEQGVHRLGTKSTALV